jgi:hypothetical protein
MSFRPVWSILSDLYDIRQQVHRQQDMNDNRLLPPRGKTLPA